jgi:sigma-B regulation protein RsbU (phosphoserine phosphatase)
VAALELGANDYVIKPLDFRVVFARVQTQLALKRATRALETANARMKKDLDAAASLQRALMPRILPDVNGAEFGWRFLPCTELAGDIFDIVQLNDDSVGIYMLDVCGHGVPAALLSVTLSRVLSHMGEEAVLKRRGLTGDYHVAAPPDVADTLNRRFPMDPETNQYFTFAYGVLDVTAREFKYVTAGHPGPIHLPCGKEPVFHDGAGFAIGWFPNPQYEERTIQLQPGDRLYFYSDGVTDAKGTGVDMFERERLADVLVESRGCLLEESLQAIVDRVTAWCGDGGPDDDISLVAFELSPA